jgi:ribosomal 50S subunit-recycling heat shock protein
MERIMRLDKYLKVSRLIKRRTVANEACDAGRVTINGKTAKASAEVKIGDIIGIGFGNKEVRAEVLEVAEIIRKEGAKELYRYL